MKVLDEAGQIGDRLGCQLYLHLPRIRSAPWRRKLRPLDLETIRLLTHHQGRKVPMVGAMLLFGRERERHFPDTWMQVGRFSGTEF